MLAATLLAFDGPKFHAYKRPVTTWVPPYAVEASRTQLEATREGVGMKDGLTHLALQFWSINPAGGLKRSGGIDDSTIIKFREWAHQHGIRVLLCVFNGENKWDWPLAKNAFAAHGTTFAKELLAEVARLNLDGIDVDLEGPGEFEADKPAFVAFVASLSKELHASKKHLTLDTFSAAKWNTPNQTWWPELFPLVDAITSMGYDDSGRNATEWRGYAAQKKAAGKYASKLQLGLPGFKGTWRGNTLAEQLEWIQADGSMSVGIWDAQLQTTEWQTGGTWRSIGKIRGEAPTSSSRH